MKERRRLPAEEFRFIYSRVPRLCVDLVFVTEAGVLLSRRDVEPGRGLWHFPGGTVLLGESLPEALDRVAEEETGLSVLRYELLGPIEFLPETNTFFHSVSIAYRITPGPGEPRVTRHNSESRYVRSAPGNTVEEHLRFAVERGLLER